LPAEAVGTSSLQATCPVTTDSDTVTSEIYNKFNQASSFSEVLSLLVSSQSSFFTGANHDSSNALRLSIQVSG
jgi:hypothetical protein